MRNHTVTVAGIVTAAFLVLLAVIATAQAQQQSDLTTPLVRAFLSKEPDIVWRKNLALAFLNNCSELSSKVARNSPREGDWLSGELNSNDANRMFRVMETIEFSRWTMALHVEECIRLTRELSAKDLPRTREAILWARLVRQLNDNEGIVKHGKRLGLIQDASVDPFALFWLGAIRLSILERALIPLLEGN